LATITAQGDGGGMVDPMMPARTSSIGQTKLGTLFVAVILGDS